MSLKKFLPAVATTRTLSALRVLVGTAALVFATSVAHAAPVYVNSNTDFSAHPTTIDFGGGLATYTFTYLGGFGTTVDAVSTGGTAQINYFTFFGQDQPVSFQIDSEIGSTGYPFKAFPNATGIDYSIAEVFLGLKFTLNDGDHFGFAELAGSNLVGFGFESAVNTPIVASERFGAVDVPEPLTLSLFSAGLLGAAALRRRKKSAQA